MNGNTARPETVLDERAGNGTRTYLTALSQPVRASGFLSSYGPRAIVTGVHRWYDPHTRSWVIYAVDENGHQVGQSEYVATLADARTVVSEFISEALSCELAR